MKVYISADIEGVCGALHWDQATLGHVEYERLRAQMQREVGAACEGALAAGATEVWVKDAHDTGRNLDGAALPSGVRLISGWSGHPLAMVQELDASFAALVLVGYHARAGSGGNALAHTFSSSRVAELRLDGRPASEFLMHAWAAWTLGVPTVFVSGDAALCAEVAELIPPATTVATMRGVGRSVVARHPAEAAAAIRAGVEAALRGERGACGLSGPAPTLLEVVYKDPVDAYRRSFYPGAERVGEDTVAVRASDYLELLRAVLFVVRA